MNTELLKRLYSQFSQYESWLNKQALSVHTKRAYRSRINHFLVFLATAGVDYSEVLEDAQTRRRAVDDYKRHLQQEVNATSATINTTLSSIDYFCKFLGVEPVGVSREAALRQTRQALTAEEQERFLAAVQRARFSKYRALAHLLLYTGIRLGECAALNVEDVSTDSSPPSISIRSSRKNRSRSIALNHTTAAALGEWLSERAALSGGASDEAVFVNRQGKRISSAGLDLVIRKLGQAAHLELSAQVLRCTCLMGLLLAGNDLRLVARIGGHKRLETTRRYCLPSITICQEDGLTERVDDDLRETKQAPTDCNIL